MKNLFIKKTISFLSLYQDYTEEEIEKLSYGLEGIYLTLTKLVIIFLLAIILNILKEVLVILLLFNILRYFGFGIHAKKSIDCLISSITCFILLPYILINLKLTNSTLFIIGIISILHIILFAPADTVKRPLYNKKKRIIRKLLTTFFSILYLILSLKLNNFLAPLLVISILIEAIMIHPITYKIMRQPYHNYLDL